MTFCCWQSATEGFPFVGQVGPDDMPWQVIDECVPIGDHADRCCTPVQLHLRTVTDTMLFKYPDFDARHLLKWLRGVKGERLRTAPLATARAELCELLEDLWPEIALITSGAALSRHRSVSSSRLRTDKATTWYLVESDELRGYLTPRDRTRLIVFVRPCRREARCASTCNSGCSVGPSDESRAVGHIRSLQTVQSRFRNRLAEMLTRDGQIGYLDLRDVYGANRSFTDDAGTYAEQCDRVRLRIVDFFSPGSSQLWPIEAFSPEPIVRSDDLWVRVKARLPSGSVLWLRARTSLPAGAAPETIEKHIADRPYISATTLDLSSG